MAEKDSVVTVSTTGSKPSWPLTLREGLFLTDSEALVEEFEREQENIFVDEDEIHITVIEIKNGGKTIRTFTEMDEIRRFCEEERIEGITRIIMIPQITSWGDLSICRPAFQLLLTAFDISPGFWAVVKLFGFKKNSDHESGGGFNEQIWDESSKSLGISYTVKHAAEHGRPESFDPWSLRQMGVHHEFHQNSDENTFVILNPSKSLRNRFEGVILDLSAGDIHQAIFSAATEKWNSYIDYLEAQCEDLNGKALSSNVKTEANTSPGWPYEVQFQDSQRTQNLQDTIHRVSHMLDLNLSVLSEILYHSSPLCSTISFSKTHQSILASLSAQTRVRKYRAESLLRRLDGISTLVRSILDALASQALQASSRTTAELAVLAREDSKMNAVFAKKATIDGRTLKTITILTLIYLPASFVATLLGTQYVHVRSNQGKVKIDLDGEMWVFGVLTVILLLITLGAWLFWEWRNRVFDRAKEAKEKWNI